MREQGRLDSGIRFGLASVAAVVMWGFALVLFVFGGVVGSYGHDEVFAFFSYLLMLALPGLVLRLGRRRYAAALLGAGYAPLVGVIYMWMVNALVHDLHAGRTGLTGEILLYFLPMFLLNLVQLLRLLISRDRVMAAQH